MSYSFERIGKLLAERELRLQHCVGARSSHLLRKEQYKTFPQALKRSDAAGFMSELKLRPPKAKSGFLAGLGMTLGGLVKRAARVN